MIFSSTVAYVDPPERYNVSDGSGRSGLSFKQARTRRVWTKHTNKHFSRSANPIRTAP